MSDAMRIAVMNWTTRRVGGAESYVELLLPALAARGHAVALVAEVDVPDDRAPIRLPDGAPCWVARSMGRDPLLAAVHEWGADVVLVNNVDDAALERGLHEAAPCVFFAHAYYGTCVSGRKMHDFPRPVPCGRRLGAACLALYYPRRCGGLNPVTMFRSYFEQHERLDRLERYARIVTGSAHMEAEYRNHVTRPERVAVLPLPAVPDDSAAPVTAGRDIASADALTLLFVGRMDRQKGGHVLAEALPIAADRLGRQLELRAVGDGPDRAGFEAAARRFAHPRVRASFPGWLQPAQVRDEMARAHLLVVPSLWPEPFGLVGPEAGSHGLPAAAFALGGIGEWLVDGVNGHLAPGAHPGSEGLASAIHACLRSPDHYRWLSTNAIDRARDFTVSRHVDALVALLGDVVRSASVPAGAAAARLA